MAFTNEPKPDIGADYGEVTRDDDGYILVSVCGHEAEKTELTGLPSFTFRIFEKEDCVFYFRKDGRDKCRLKEQPPGVYGDCDLKRYKLVPADERD